MVKNMRIKNIVVLCLIFITIALKAEAIKIGLQPQSKELIIAASVSAEIYDMNKNEVLCEIKPMTIYKFKSNGNRIFVTNSSGEEYRLGSSRVLIKTKTAGFLCFKKAWYRGNFILYNKGDGALTIINELPLEDYLKGVVPAEMPSKWNSEALKAQAIAARSYAVATRNAGKHSSEGYDLVDTTSDQAYGGASIEKATTTKAVEATKGIVLVQESRGVLPTYYHASSGGQTKVWSSGSSFLHSVPAVDGDVKKNGHGVGMSQHGAKNLAERGWNAYQILNYFYKDFKFAKLSENWDI